jgi:1-acyl-sn-glycerol-3-phosphate acyltransferase
MRCLLPLLGIRIRTSGENYFEHGRNYVVVCNHRSFMDIPVTTTRIPGPNKTIAKIEMSRIPFFGTIYRTGSVLVDRKDPRSRSESYQQMKKVLASGLHMLIYPEGTRNNSDQPLGKFHSGAFNLAVETRIPVIPATLKGTDKILPNRKFLYLLPGTISFDMLPPVEPGENAEELKKKIIEIMHNRLSSISNQTQRP